MFTVILCLIILIIYSLHYWFNKNHYAEALSKIPGLPTHFFFGNSLEISVSPVKLFSLARNWAACHDGIYRFYAFFIGTVDIYNPDDIELVTSNVKYNEKDYIYTFLKPWLKDGLLLSHGSKWLQRRKILTSAFHFNILQKYHLTIEENSKRLIKELVKTDGKTIDIVPVLSDYTLNTICETAMGTQLNDETSIEGQLYKQAVYELGKSIVKRLSQIILHTDRIFNLTLIRKKQREYVAIVCNFTKNIIKTRKRNFELKQHGSETPQNKVKGDLIETKKKKYAMLDLLLSAERDGIIDDAGIHEEVDTFMFEGHDTTAAGLTYSILSIANDESVQAKIIEELNSIFGEDTRQATMEDFTKMRYLDCCIKESLRLYPPVPFISRKLPVDTVLSGYTVPAGTFCHIHIFDLHRQERIFKDSLKFDPDRFLPENCVGRHNYAYIPFSAGPRNCIGQKFAIIEMKSALSAILRNFRLIPVTKHSDLRFMSDLVLRNSEEVYVKFVQRGIKREYASDSN